MAASLIAVAPAGAQSPQFLVTYAARTCPSYADITANLARNDIQESLQDLGQDTLYASGEAISPAKEAQGQPNCRPIVGWQFRLGTGYQSGASTGPWGSLSAVSGPYDQPVPTTQATIPLLDSQGNPTGTTLAGAVTVPLTSDQAERASQSNGLWVQGGQLDDPVLNGPFPGRYGFAALRCAIDNLNGDNVEWVGYPQGATHVFCFAYYVEPPPTSGTIVVRKVVDDPAATADQAFRYTGNISYNPDGSFSLTARYGQDGSETFFRAAGATPWTFAEAPVDGWTLVGLSCTSATGASTAVTDVATGAASVTLGAGDTVTCTYTNRLTPPPAGLTLTKVTLGGIGRFPFLVTGPQTARQTLTTRSPLVPVSGPALTLPAGTYRVAERLPGATPRGRWTAVGAICNGAPRRGRNVSVTLAAGAGARCAFANRFIPAGRLRLLKATLGGTGTVSFVVRAVGDPERSYRQSATTTRTATPVLAKGDDLSSLPLGAYDIIEASAAAGDGRWALAAVVCGGKPQPAQQGRVRVVLTTRRPRLQCTFVDRLEGRPVPPQPGPTPAPAPDGDVTPLQPADGPNADLAVTKRVSPPMAAPGQTVRYRVVVTNRGPAVANDVGVAEVRPASQRQLRIRTTRGSCRGDRPARCTIGTLAPGQRAVITVTARARPGPVTVNRVAVLSATRDPVLANNLAAARLFVARPRVTG